MSKKETKKSNEVQDEKKENIEEQKNDEAVTEKKSKKAEDKTEALEKEIADLKDTNLRIRAEFDNYKRRTQKEKESTYEYAVCDAVKNLIPILDTLELSIKNESKDEKAFHQGIELIVKNFKDTLAKMGVTPIDAVGQPFNPELHNAVMQADEGDEESGVVTEEFQKGYKLNERVIRHSMVKVKA